jgi:NADH-quinone oxidoreductase subunit D
MFEQEDIQDVRLDEIKHLVSERALQGETILLNMGPQHPSTHGVLRLLLELDGEVVINCIPDIGFLHTGIEKNMEAKTYEKANVMTDRIDYLNTIGNVLVYCLAIEKLADLDVPPRAQAIRVILAELNRIASHLVWLGTHALDLAAMSVFLYTFREREAIMDIHELCSGARMMTTYFRPGGLWRDVPAEFEIAVRRFLRTFSERIDQYEALLTKNPIFVDRTKGIGKISADDAIKMALSGPALRASGPDYDIRKRSPYSGYEQYSFDVPTGTAGDVYERYIVRIAEMRQSLRIVQQALDRLPYGPVRSNNRKYVPPPRAELGVSMEAVIHHFKLWQEGFHLPAGSVYMPIEGPRGELGVYLESDGGTMAKRVHWRTPTFANLQALPLLSKGHLVADLVAIIGSIDIVLEILIIERIAGSIRRNSNDTGEISPIITRSSMPRIWHSSAIVISPGSLQESLILRHPTDVGSLVGFYTLYHAEPGGTYSIQVCNDLPCALRGADEFLDKLCENLNIRVGETTADGLVTIEAVTCLAGCDRAPLFQVQTSEGLSYHENQSVESTLG